MNFYMPTQIIWGDSCVKDNIEKLNIGKKAIIVCGKSSAKKCGALDDVTEVLEKQGIDYVIFNKIMENPTVEVCFEGGKLAYETGADFVIAIGGGSAMDASKAIAAYAVNPQLEMMEIYLAKIYRMLPIIAIPTTAGTGSEVNPYSVMTTASGRVKKTFKAPKAFPKYAFLDARYTETLNFKQTVSTALDAFCHCIESYLSPKSTDISRGFAVCGAKKIIESLYNVAVYMEKDDFESLKSERESLLAGSCFGGLAIGTTGTGFNHPLGYNLTLYYGVPHGNACAVFMKDYIDYNMRSPEGAKLIAAFCKELSTTPKALAEFLVKLADIKIKLSDSEIDEYIGNVKSATNYSNSPYVICEAEMREIYSRNFQ